MPKAISMIPTARRTLVAFTITLPLLVAACTQNTPPTTTLHTYQYLGDAPMPATATVAEIEADFGGKVLVAHPEDNSALLGFDQKPADTSKSGKALLSLDVNAKIFNSGGAKATMNGRKITWASGDLKTWASGRKITWASGTYQLVPENTTSFQQIGLDTAQTLAPKLGAGVKIAVIDTGLDLNHIAFTNSLAPTSEWKDFVDGDNVPQDVGTLGEGGYGHGTAVAAIALQIAPSATILPIRVLGSDGSGDVQAVAQGIDWAVSKGAKIINLSLGSDERSAAVYNAMLRAARKGVQIVTSSGNDNANKLTYPAADTTNLGLASLYATNVVSVNNTDDKASFSNYNVKAQISAPGEDIFTAGPGNLLVAWSGTSMSAPIISGTLALAYGEPTNNIKLDWAWATKLELSATDIYSNGKNSSYLKQLGTIGRLNIPAFLKSGL